MTASEALRHSRIALTHGSGAIPVVGFGTLIPGLAPTKQATNTALEVGFRHFDCAERYRNEQAVGEALREAFDAGTIALEEVFVTTKLWNTNHRPERVRPAFDASCRRLQVDHVDCYLIHTPYAFAPGDDQDPRDEHGNVINDEGVTLAHDVAGARAPRRRPYLPEWELLDFCRDNGIVLLAFAPLGHSMQPNLLEDNVITAVAKRLQMSPAQVALSWAAQRGSAFLTTSTKPQRISENYQTSPLPDDAMSEIRDHITTNIRFNSVVQTGVPGFIPRPT